MMSALDSILDILFPKICLGCGKEGQYLCQNCEIFLSEVDPVYLPKVNGVHLREVQNVISVWEYEGVMEKLIHKIKFEGCYHIIDELVEKAFERIVLELPEDAFITFVPMHKKKERERGFNQAELIAKKIGTVLSLAKHKPFGVLQLLKKVRDNRSQVGLSPKERIENVKDAFKFWTCDVHWTSHVQNVLLVDDVYTTGATMNECIKTLKKAGVKNVWGFTLARKLTI